ncbi:MAG: hypothetical protein JWL87_408 [Candidatus Adlerbacteria bacterium]|nr:hypothetical protein [Candidatus Adlerbacteria bacterium]
METPKATPKDFFLWAGAMVALYGSVVAFLGLVFDYINYAMPDMALNYYVDPYSSIAYEMASLIVLAPLFLALMRVIRRDIARDHTRNEVWVRRWALFLTLFIAGATIAIDLIVLLTTFLNGEELSMRFLLKVLVVLLVASAGFMHFVADLWGYWVKNPSYARYINWAVALLVVLTVIAGFFIVGTPAEARKARLDNQRVQDLQSIQWQVVNYWQQKERLPVSITDLEDPIAGYSNPRDPETGELYVYRPGQGLSFTLCAAFAAEGNANWGKGEPMPVRAYGTLEGDWAHGAGETCYTRTIDPERYPPTGQKAVQSYLKL